MEEKKVEENKELPKTEAPKTEAPKTATTKPADNKKPDKKKKSKPKLVPFEQIDITTATEDEIIRSGIKHNTKLDVTCYLIMFCIFCAAILPVALRIIIPRPITKVEEDIVYYDITCYKSTVRDGYELSSVLEGHYRDGAVNEIKIDFKYFKRNADAKDGYIFTEIDQFEKLKDVSGVKFSKETGKAKVTLDFENNEELRNNEALTDYTHFAVTEITVLHDNLGFSCDSTNDTKRELIYVDTRKKVE